MENQRGGEIERQRDTEMENHRETQRQREKKKQRDSKTERQKDRETERQRDREITSIKWMNTFYLFKVTAYTLLLSFKRSKAPVSDNIGNFFWLIFANIHQFLLLYFVLTLSKYSSISIDDIANDLLSLANFNQFQ
jgi:hypothetical protein